VSQHRETEVKLKVDDTQALKRRLAEIGFRRASRRQLERDYVFDFPDQRLRKARCLLRLRLLNGRGLLTFKGRPYKEVRYKSRQEAETVVEDASGLREILGWLGLKEVFRYEKFRTMYALKGDSVISSRHHLVYDETPIGTYVELEGPKQWIDMVARQLGYRPKHYITASYATLYRQECRARGVKPSNMIFSRRKS